ncbi:MAG TPA: membrane protein insertase YidC [Caulobacteraceae bacterium]|jgi:YidC/Oxa1 family membrane protein insertase
MQPQQQDNARNTIFFVLITAAILIGYQMLVLQPAARQRAEQQRVAAAATDANATVGRPDDAAAPVSQYVDRAQAAAASPRTPIATPSLRGSIALRGGRIDDLYLTRYRETLAANSPPVELFRPQGAEHAYFSQTGWLGDNVPGLPRADTLWTLQSGAGLAPGRPVVLTYDNGAGLRFTRTISVDDQYMFTIADAVTNAGTAAVQLRPFGSVQRQGLPSDIGSNMILHEGAVGALSNPDRPGRFELELHKYKDWGKKGTIQQESVGGWLGVTDKYWMAALIPAQQERISAEFRVRDRETANVHMANMTGAPRLIQPGQTTVSTTRLFAGAKRNEVLSGYQSSLSIPRFDDAIDWGMFWFLTKPIFMLVEWFYGLVGNFGVAILLLTVVVKLALFPLANKAYESMSKMKNLQPKMEEIKARHKDDQAKLQQETMALYQREKINPLAGCLPILVQIPVFYALYKVLFVTIEMRHAPFFGWITDLSARDPSTIWTLFGAIPWDPATAPMIGGLLNGPLHLGVLPLFYGLTMWLQQAMNPPAPDPVQRQIFAFMPFIFTFIMAPFAVGLLIYWCWNNILSILQQYLIMRRFKADNPIDRLLARLKPKEG